MLIYLITVVSLLVIAFISLSIGLENTKKIDSKTVILTSVLSVLWFPTIVAVALFLIVTLVKHTIDKHKNKKEE